MKKASRFLLWTALLLPVCVHMNPAYAEKPLLEVSVQDQTSVKGEKIFLKEICQWSEPQHPLVNALEKVSVGFSPLPGQVKTIYPSQIQSALFLEGIDTSKITFSIPKQITVRRLSQELSWKTLQQKVSDYILTHVPWDKSQVEISFSQKKASTILPLGKMDLSISTTKNSTLLGRQRFLVTILLDGQPEKKIWIPATIAVNIPVLVAVGKLERGHILSESDLLLREMDMAGLRAGVLTDPAEAMGKKLNRTVRPNTPLLSDYLEQPIVVQRGDVVTIKAENKNLLVTAQGKALENGSDGDLIRVMNLSSKTEIYSQVIGPRTVQVRF